MNEVQAILQKQPMSARLILVFVQKQPISAHAIPMLQKQPMSARLISILVLRWCFHGIPNLKWNSTAARVYYTSLFRSTATLSPAEDDASVTIIVAVLMNLVCEFALSCKYKGSPRISEQLHYMDTQQPLLGNRQNALVLQFNTIPTTACTLP